MINAYFVQYTRFFEELGFDDFDVKDFDNLSDAWNFYQEKVTNGDANAQLWQKTEGITNIRLH